MGADGAHLGSFFAHDDMTAVAALPHLDAALFEDLLGLHIFQQRAVALLVVLLDGGHAPEFGGKLGKAFLLGGDGEALIHVGPLVILTVGRGGQILGGGADAAQLLEPELGVFFLVVGGLQEKGCDLLKALLLGLGRKLGVLVSGLGLAGEGGLQVLLGLGPGITIAGHGKTS